MSDMKQTIQMEQAIDIPSGKIRLEGELKLPKEATGVVLFADGSGSSRHSPRNQYVARVIREAGVGTLLFDLLTGRTSGKRLVQKEVAAAGLRAPTTFGTTRY